MITIELNARGQRYVTTCYCPENEHPERAAKLDELRERMGEELISLELDKDLFPGLFAAHRSGIISTPDSVHQYFESLGPTSHNRLLYARLPKIASNNLPDEILNRILDDTIGCMVRVTRTRDGATQTLKGIERLIVGPGLLDTATHSVSGEYLFTHGLVEGKRVAISEATANDFRRFNEWYVRHQIKDIYQFRALLAERKFPSR